MLMYVIPLIILIVVLLVVKKRQDAQGSNQPAKKGNTKSKAKKSSSTRSSARPTKIVEDDIVETKTTQPLSADTRKKIETLIRDHNFFAAEAQINQALKRDNSQHELYLLLLDVHLEQKDDFAVNQLLSHLNALELHDIVQQAEAKVADKKSSAKDNDLIQFTPNQIEPTQQSVKPAHQDSVSDDAFDALISTPTASTPIIEEQKPTFEEAQLEFNAPIVSETPESIEPVVENTPLEFDPSFATAATQPQVEAEPVVDEIKPLDFSFTLSSNEELTAEKPNQQVEIVAEEPLKANEFNLDFISSQTPIAEPEKTNVAVDEQPVFSFNLDSIPSSIETATEVEIESNINSSFAEDIASTPISTEAPIVAISNLDNADPLVQSFPSLTEINEVELNLDLAQKYIELGAYDAARAILADNEADYSTEQRQVADQLLNQIAS